MADYQIQDNNKLKISIKLIGIVIFIFGLSACTLPFFGEKILSEEINPQEIVLGLLEELSESPINVTFEGGFPTFVGTEVRVFGNSAPERAIDFLTRFKPLYLLDDPNIEFKVRKIGGFNGEDIYFYQTYKGLEIFGSELVVSLDRDIVYASTGKMLHYIDIDISPVLSAAEAESSALIESGGQSDLVVGETSLMIFDPSSLGDVPANPRLVWKVSLAGTNLTQLFIDAESGEVLFSYFLSESLLDLDIEDANGTNAGDDCYWWTTPDDQIGDEDGIFPDINDSIADDVYDYAVRTYDFYVENFNWYSYDGSDSKLFVYIHTNVDNANWKSGFWCNFIEFSDPYVAYDIFVHEFTHAVINHTSLLIYADQSGALNESYADVMAAVAEGNWQLGEDSVNGQIRDMTSPRVDHWDKLITTTAAAECDTKKSGYNDCGFVHSNSGITNKAAYLIARGGFHNGWTIRPLHDDVVLELFGNVMVSLPSNASLLMARDRTVNLADRTLNQLDACQVRNAFASVGLGFGDFDCDGLEDIDDLDSDNDSIPDSIDNCDLRKNVDQVDTDGDGVGDACTNDFDGDGINNYDANLIVLDNCLYVANPLQEDADGDGFGDACDDTGDFDGILDVNDNCPDKANPDQVDTDSDGLGNECDDDDDNDGKKDSNDNCPLTSNFFQSDLDGDGVGDACDNCKNDPNPDQVDTDSDGLGNECDDDDDNDGVLDVDDNCQLAINPRQGDFDLDGIGDICDFEDFPALIKMADNIGVMFSFTAFHEQIIKVPTEICFADCPDWFPEDYEFGIEFVEGVPVNLGLWVSDQYGRLAGKTHIDNGKLVLHFKPKGGMRYFINVVLASESALENGEKVEIGMNFSYGDYDEHALFEDTDDDVLEPAEQEDNDLDPTATALNNSSCRIGADPQFEVRNFLYQGEQAEVIGRISEGDWFYVELPNDFGRCWIFGENLELSGPIASLPLHKSPELPSPDSGAGNNGGGDDDGGSDDDGSDDGGSVPAAPPQSPSNFSLVNEVCSGAAFNISLFWTDNSGNEDGFRVYRDGGLVATLSANATSYSENAGNTNSGYTYKVVAYNGVGESNGPSLSTSVCPFG